MCSNLLIEKKKEDGFRDLETRENFVPFAEKCLYVTEFTVKGAFSGLSRFLAIESSLKVMKNLFYFPLKACFVLKIFKFLY